MSTYIITKSDTWCSRSVTLSRYDDEIVVLKEPHEYQYLIDTDTKTVENILVIRVLKELFHSNVCNSKIKVIGIELGPTAQRILDLLKRTNTVEIIRNTGNTGDINSLKTKDMLGIVNRLQAIWLKIKERTKKI